ncbi:asparagine synthase-related protein [candidate division KSB1 bacterium]
MQETDLKIGYTKYDGYPVTIKNSDGSILYFEGYNYNENQDKFIEELNAITNKYIHHNKAIDYLLKERLLKSDGDFIFLKYDPVANTIIVINDVLGRLPLYYYQENDKILVSREIKFILNLINRNTVNRTAVNQNLLFGYTLGNATLYQNIFSLKPGTILKIDLKSSSLSLENYHSFNFDEKENHNRSVKENAVELASLFSKACKNRSDMPGLNIVSLSGGLDSRSVAACLHKNKIPFISASFLDYEKDSSADINIAEKLAKILNTEWKLVKLQPAKGKDHLQLLAWKCGLNYLGMSFILQYFEKLIDFYGSRLVFFTGDGGDKLLPQIEPNIKIKNIGELAEYIYKRNRLFLLSEVSNLTGTSEKIILDELLENLSLYPERDFNNKYLHFMLFERGFKWLLEGEDRNRCSFWSVSPFYSTPFFNYAMNCPAKQKNQYQLYRHFLSNISKEIAEVDYPNINRSILSKKLTIRHVLNSFLLRFSFINNIAKSVKFREKYIKNAESFNQNSNYLKCLKNQINNCQEIGDYLSIDEIGKILEGKQKSSKMGFLNLFTLTSVIENLFCDNNSIRRYRSDDFIL